MDDTALVVRRKSPTLAGILSALICGLGQVYSGRTKRGILLFLIFGVLVAMTTAVWIFGVVDALAGNEPVTRP